MRLLALCIIWTSLVPAVYADTSLVHFKNIDIPYSLVESWKEFGSFNFPVSLKIYTPKQILALQYFLIANGYDVSPTAKIDSKTKSALNSYQGVDSDQLTQKTRNDIDAFFANVYCPTMNVQKQSVDYRLMNVNPVRVLPKNYIPDNLIIEKNDEFNSRGPVCLESDTYSALQKMYTAAKSEGVSLFITSSYRDEKSQKYLLKVLLGRIGKRAYEIVAPAGMSEHNLATSIDVAAIEGGKKVALYASPQIKWLYKNAWKYGFVNSYPEGKEKITGFPGEPWHWRFAGETVAKAVEDSGITLAEYIAKNHETIARAYTKANAYGKYGSDVDLDDIDIGG